MGVFVFLKGMLSSLSVLRLRLIISQPGDFPVGLCSGQAEERTRCMPTFFGIGRVDQLPQIFDLLRQLVESSRHRFVIRIIGRHSGN